MRNYLFPQKARLCLILTGLLVAIPTNLACQASDRHDLTRFPWMDTSLSPDERADMVLHVMTLDEKLQLVNGAGRNHPVPARSNLGAGFLNGIDRLGIPDINEADSAVGVRMAASQGRYATLLPSTLAAASSWDTDAAFLYGSVIGRELHQQGFNMSIGGGVNIAREPRNGRNFEYAGEDPVLAGTMTGNLMRGVAAQQVMTDIKHYAMNDQETGRTTVNVLIDKRAMRESDLLAFQIAIGIAHPSGVMCSYNLVNNDYACENDYLLNQVLKKDFGFKGFVLSDWGATHSTVKAALAGLDQDMPGNDGFFEEKLKQAVQIGLVPTSRLDDMVHRVLRSMFAAGVIDHPPLHMVVDPFLGLEDAQHITEESIVLLRNQDNLLPIKANASGSIALIGSHADVGMLSGGGSAQVTPPGGNVVQPESGTAPSDETIYFPLSPLKFIRAKAIGREVTFDSGTNLASAASRAKSASVAIVFVNQPMRETVDATTLSLPDNQDALVEAVAAANTNTIVVLETGGPVAMPWAGQVKAILAAWYPGIAGAQALANILFGDVNPSGKLPITFARDDADLPHPHIVGKNYQIKTDQQGTDARLPVEKEEKHLGRFDLTYTEGAKVGYKWFDAERKPPLFPFGFGLTYTSFVESGLSVDSVHRMVRFTITNTGPREGTEIAQVYVALPPAANENYKRLVAWQRVKLAPGESKTVSLPLNPLYMSVFDVQKDSFAFLPGNYKVMLGSSSRELPQAGILRILPEN
jgi:beta-glucosidase